jgi:SAM-dependent methyltransferase
MSAPDDRPDGRQELWDLENLASAEGLGDWMFEQFAPYARGRAVEVGAGIGTFSRRLLDHGVDELLLIEPEPACLERLHERFDGDPRCTVSGELLPDAPSLRARAGSVEFIVCQNVLEHIADDAGAVRAMSDALAPGGVLSLLLPAHPRLYGRLDRLYGHERRYTRSHLRGVVEGAGLDVVDLYSFNALGILGWLTKSRVGEPSLDPRSLRAYERLLPLYRPIERRVRLPVGLSLVVHARKP